MAQYKQYKLRYLPLFWEDLSSALNYISFELNNVNAAKRLVDKVEREILKHAQKPTIASKYKTTRKRANPYYWFSVGNYMVFYVVIDDVVEMRRFIYKTRDIDVLI